MTRLPLLSAFLALAVALLGPSGARTCGAVEFVVGMIVSVSGKVMIRQERAGASKDLHPALPGKEVYVGDIITTPSDGRIKLLLRDRSIMDVGPSSLFKMDQLKVGAGGQREVDATMPYGTLRAGVTRKLEGKSHFKVRTASATMGVRGTEFVVKSEIGDLQKMNQILSAPPGELPKMDLAGAAGAAPRTEVTVLQGRVEVGTPQAPPGGPGASAGGPGAGAQASAVLTPGMQLVAGAGMVPDGEGRGPASGGSEVRTLDTQKLSEVASTSRVQDKTFEQAATIQGTTRDEESQARREEKREERQEERREARADEKRPEDKGPGDKREEARGESRQAQAPQEGSSSASTSTSASGDSRQAQAPQESSSTSGRTPASSGSSSTSGIALLTTAVTTNVQVAAPVVQTIRVADVVPNAVSSTQAVTQEQPVLPTVHTLTIRIQTPPPPQ